MTTKIDGKQILRSLRVKSDNSKISFYLSKNLYNSFKNACGEVPANKVLQKLMEEFITSIKGPKRGR